MKATSIKTVYLKECELKQAIVEYLEKTEEDLAQHLYDNDCSMEWKEVEVPRQKICSRIILTYNTKSSII